MNRTQKYKKLLSPKAGALSVLSYSPMACFAVWWHSLHVGGQGLQILYVDQFDLEMCLCLGD